MAALGGVRRGPGWSYGPSGDAGFVLPDDLKIGNSAKHLSAMAEQDADVLKVLICQIAENRDIDPIFSKTLRVLGHAEFCEPVRNLRRCAHLPPPIVAAEPGFLCLPTGELSHTPSTTSMANDLTCP